jgi:hypothetical protein
MAASIIDVLRLFAICIFFVVSVGALGLALGNCNPEGGGKVDAWAATRPGPPVSRRADGMMLRYHLGTLWI